MSQKKRKLKKKLVEYELTKEQGSVVEGISLLETIKKYWFFLLLITLGITAVYANGMNANFVSDDYASITQNTQIKDFKVMLGSLNSTAIVTYIIGNTFGIDSPLPFHLFNLILFLVICYLSFAIVEKMFGGDIAMITTAIFSVLPIHVEAVTWISGRPYLFIALYVLAAFWVFLRMGDTGRWKYAFMMIGLFLMGFLTDNPRPFSLFLIVFVYLATIGFKGYERIARITPWLVLIMVVSLIVAWPHILHRVQIVNGGYNASESLFYNPLFQYPTGISKYMQILWMPFDLTLYHTMYFFPNWLNWSIFLIYGIMIGYFFVYDRRYFFALSFIFVAVLPSIMPVKVSWLVAERYMFLGSLGFCLFLGLIIQNIWRKQKWLATTIVVILMVLYSVRTFIRNIDWQTNHNLWVNTCQVSPNSHNAWNNIGDDYDKLKQYDNAIKGFTQSTIVKPNYADAFHNRANILFKIGRLDLARDSYNTAIYFSPTLYQTYLSLINIDLVERRLDLALEHATKAQQIQPNDPTANYVLAVVYSQRGENDKAKTILENILRVYPSYTQAQNALIQLRTGSS